MYIGIVAIFRSRDLPLSSKVIVEVFGFPLEGLSECPWSFWVIIKSNLPYPKLYVIFTMNITMWYDQMPNEHRYDVKIKAFYQNFLFSKIAYTHLHQIAYIHFNLNKSTCTALWQMFHYSPRPLPLTPSRSTCARCVRKRCCSHSRPEKALPAAGSLDSTFIPARSRRVALRPSVTCKFTAFTFSHSKIAHQEYRQ